MHHSALPASLLAAGWAERTNPAASRKAPVPDILLFPPPHLTKYPTFAYSPSPECEFQFTTGPDLTSSLLGLPDVACLPDHPSRGVTLPRGTNTIGGVTPEEK